MCIILCNIFATYSVDFCGIMCEIFPIIINALYILALNVLKKKKNIQNVSHSLGYVLLYYSKILLKFDQCYFAVGKNPFILYWY